MDVSKRSSTYTKDQRRECFTRVVTMLIEERGIAQRQVARALGTSASNLNQRIQAGSMSADMVMSLEEVLGCSSIVKMVRDHLNGADLKEVVEGGIELRILPTTRIESIIRDFMRGLERS